MGSLSREPEVLPCRSRGVEPGPGTGANGCLVPDTLRLRPSDGGSSAATCTSRLGAHCRPIGLLCQPSVDLHGCAKPQVRWTPSVNEKFTKSRALNGVSQRVVDRWPVRTR